MIEEPTQRKDGFPEWARRLIVTIFMGFGSWMLIDEIVVNERLGLPSAETFLAAALAAAIFLLFLSPREHESFLWSASEDLFFIISFYLAFWKIPVFLRPMVSIGIGRALCLIGFFIVTYVALKIAGYERRAHLLSWLCWSLFWVLYLLMLGSFAMGRQ